MTGPRQHKRTVLMLLVVVGIAAIAGAQRGGFFGGRFRMPPNPPYDGAFRYCRGIYQPNPVGDGGGWTTDYPQADVNLSFRLSELTKTSVSRDDHGNFNHANVSPLDDEFYRCPFVMMAEVGRLYLNSEEAERLRNYLLKGGFLWVDDFWGEYAWRVFETEIRKVFPANQYPIVDIPASHQIFHTLYEVKGVSQIPSIGFYLGTGGTSERGADSREPHARAIFDEKGHLMVLITHNTDYGDAFEREGESREYFDRFAGLGYAFGINALVYAMTH
jgi:uncharacterized protein DUF4159